MEGHFTLKLNLEGESRGERLQVEAEMTGAGIARGASPYR